MPVMVCSLTEIMYIVTVMKHFSLPLLNILLFFSTQYHFHKYLHASSSTMYIFNFLLATKF